MSGNLGFRRFAFGIMALSMVAGIVVTGILSAQPRALEVILTTPRGERDEMYSIEVSFSEPMVALGSRGAKAPRSIVRFSPELKGNATWLGTSVYSLVLESPPPAGTRITATIPAGTKSLSGAKLERDYVWTIEYRRPRLIASVPALWTPPNEREPEAEPPASFPEDEPLLLAFDRPVSRDAAKRIQLFRGGEALELTKVEELTYEQLDELAVRAGVDSLQPNQVIALRPTQPLAPDTVHELRAPADLGFPGADLPLQAETRLRFRTLAAPGIAGVEIDPWEMRIRMRAPVDAESLLAHLNFEPRPRRLSAWSYDPMQVAIQGSFPADRSVRITLTRGLTDLYGRPFTAPFTTEVRTPHAPMTLSLAPTSGAIIPGPGEFVRLSVENSGAVTIRAIWLMSAELPTALSREDTDRPYLADDRASWPLGGAGRWMSWTWEAPAAHADSLLIWEKKLDAFGQRPATAVALYLEASAEPLFPRPDQEERARARALLQLATISITSRLGAEHGLLWVTDLDSGQPVPGADVALWAAPDSLGRPPVRPLWSGRTDTDGIAWSPGLRTLAPRGTPQFAYAESSGRRCWLELSTRWGWGESIAAPAKPAAFLFTDRPLYRPGERVEWKAYVRKADAKGLQPADRIDLEAVFEREGVVLATERVRLNALGNAAGGFVLPDDAPPGFHLVSLREVSPTGDGAMLTASGISVEYFRAPRFRANVTVAPEQITSGGSVTAEGQFQYFAGGALGGQPVEWFLSLAPTYWRPRGWEEFSFQDDPPRLARAGESLRARGRRAQSPWAGSGPTLLREGAGLLDREGRLRVDLPVTLPSELSDSRALFEMGARDLADQSAFDRASFEVLRGPIRIGVKPSPRAEGERSSTVAWQWVVTDTSGQIVPGRAVLAELYRQDWKTVRIRRLGGVFDYENYPADTLVSRGEFVSLDRAFEQRVEVPGPGQYRLRLLLRDDPQIAAASTQWVAGPEESSGQRPTTWWIEIGADREHYAADDTVRLVVPAPTSGAQALVVLESGDLIRARRVSLSGTPEVLVPLGGLAPPDATIRTTLVGPDRVPTAAGDGPRRFLPYHASAATSVTIERGRWQAQVELTPEKSIAAPGETLEVRIHLRDANGNPAAGEVTLWGVDEAVLALTGDSPTDPLGTLLSYRGSETIGDDLRSQLVLSPTLDRGKESIGGGGAESAGFPVRRNFRPTAYWNPSIPIGPDGVALVRVPLPDDLTSYRFRAVGVTMQNAFGSADASVRVSRDLEIEAALPRFARVGDRLTVGGIVRNRSDRQLEVQVDCEIRGGKLSGSAKAKRKLAPGENWRSDFTVETPTEGQLEVTLRASATGLALSDAVTRTLPVEAPLYRETEIAFGRATPRGAELLDTSRPGLESGALQVSISASLLSGLEPSVDYLRDYPHLCLEQLDSRLAGALARKSLGDRFESTTTAPADMPADLDAEISGILGQIATRLSPDGFAIWPGGLVSSHPYLDAYTAWLLSRAEAAKAAPPPGLVDDAVFLIEEALSRDARNQRAPAITPATRAFLSWIWLEVRGAEAGVTESDLEEILTQEDQLGTVGRLALGLAHDRLDRAESGVRGRRGGGVDARVFALVEAAAATANRTATHVSFGETLPHAISTYASDEEDRVRATAMAVLLLARRQPENALLPVAARWLLDERSAGHWGNTHENAWALIALEEYVSAAESLRLPLNARLTLGTANPKSARFETGKTAPRVFRFTRDELLATPRSDRESGTVSITIESEGPGPVYYEIRLDRSFPAMDQPAREEGLIVWREYVAARGAPRKLEHLTRGEPALVHLAVLVPRSTSYLMLEDVLPAGLEPVHLEFQTTSRVLYSETPTDSTRLPVTHRERRDDRVRFYTEEIAAGVYHVFYPVTPTTAGRFQTPGARAELLYAPEYYGLSEPIVIEVQ